jgi:hypothetical protein
MKALPPLLLCGWTVWLSFQGTDIISLWLITICLFFPAALLSFLLPFELKGVPLLKDRRTVKALTQGAFLLSVSALALNWPLRVAFLLSRPALEQLASEVQAGKTLHFPRKAGYFTIHSAGTEQTYPDVFYMRTSNGMILAPLTKKESQGKFNVDFLVPLGFGWVWVDDD